MKCLFICLICGGLLASNLFFEVVGFILVVCLVCCLFAACVLLLLTYLFALVYYLFC